MKSRMFNKAADQAELASSRLTKNFENAGKLVSDHPAEGALAIGCLAVATVYFTAPMILALCVSALVLLAVAYFKEPTPAERVTEFARAAFR